MSPSFSPCYWIMLSRIAKREGGRGFILHKFNFQRRSNLSNMAAAAVKWKWDMCPLSWLAIDNILWWYWGIFVVYSLYTYTENSLVTMPKMSIVPGFVKTGLFLSVKGKVAKGNHCRIFAPCVSPHLFCSEPVCSYMEGFLLDVIRRVSWTITATVHSVNLLLGCNIL